MYQIVYHGPDRTSYRLLQDGLPADMRLSLEHNKSRLGYALNELKPQGLILPLSDPGPEDLGYLRKVIALPESPGVIVTANRISAQQAVSCMRVGAYDCFTGPVSGDIVGASLKRMISSTGASRRMPRGAVGQLQGESSAVVDLRARLREYATMDYPVLITGETGSGKELAARMIHRCSTRCDGPFTAVNCATYPDDLLGSELFGSRRGAFTGSVDRPGIFENTRGGVLFLDEIGELSLQGQACLLRVMEENVVRRMGSFRSIPVDVRIVAATNRPLRDMMKERIFRPDLFYRLDLLGVTVPPLRKRKEDFAVLVRDYLQTIASEGRWRLDNAALATLTRYNWPGNVRELQSVILRATLSARGGVIRNSDLCLNRPGERQSRTR